MSSPAAIKLSVLLVVIAGYLVLGYPFMQLRIPPTGVGVPIGELALAALLLSINWPMVLARIGTVVALLPLLVWWGWGFTRLVFDAIREGPWAFRDGTQLIEALYLVVGFAVVVEGAEIARVSRWFGRIIGISCAFGLLYVFSNELMAISPTLPGGSDQPIPIIGTFATTGTMLLLGAFLCMIQSGRTRSERLGWALLAGLLVSYAVLVIQARTTYVQLVCLAGLLLLVRPSALRRLAWTIPVLCVLVVLVSTFEVRISGRLSSEISWSWLADHVLTIFGIGTKGTLGEAAGGVSLRFGWWLRLYGELTSDPATLLSGLGFGVPLTDFRDSFGVVAREPHNSIISVVARLGLVGGIAWIWLQVELFRLAYVTHRAARRLGRHDQAQLILLIMAFAALTLASCVGEDSLEKPYNAIPYYALWGVVLRIAYQIRATAAATPASSTTQTVARGAS